MIAYQKKMHSPDMSHFTARFHYKGVLVFDSAHRIGAERSLAVDAPDTPVLRTVDGRPYLPGSSIKGAWRAYSEAIMRTIQAQQGHERFANDPLEQEDIESFGLTDKKISNIKAAMRQAGATEGDIDEELRKESTWVGRVFGNSALAAKLLIKDAIIDPASWLRSEIRDGVGIDRDSGRAGQGLKYQFEVVPAGAQFPFEFIVENPSDAELGMVMLGVRAFERGDILLGGAKSRGLGWCRLESNRYQECRYVAGDNLLDYLLGEDTQTGVVTGEMVQSWLQALKAAIEVEAKAGGKSDA